MPIEANAHIARLSDIPTEVLEASGQYGQVYSLQQQLRSAERQLDFTIESISEDYQRSNRNRGIGNLVPLHEVIDHTSEVIALRAKIAELRTQVAEGRQQVGGIVFLPATERIAEIEKRLAALNRKAAKLGTEPITFTVTDEKLVLAYKTDDQTQRDSKIAHTFAVLTGSTPKLDGFEFLATITPTEHGNLVKKIPAAAFGYRHNLDDRSVNAVGETKFSASDSAAGQALDAIDLTRFRSTGTDCEHCKKIRARSDLYVVYNEATGEALQVGRTCLRDYMGSNNPEAVVKLLEQIFEFIRSISEEGSRGSVEAILTEELLTHCATIMRVEGKYISGLGRDGLTNFRNMVRKARSKDGQQLWVDPIEADRIAALDALKWARTEWDESGDFAYNVKTAIAGEVVPSQAIGFAGAVFSALNRWLGIQAKKASQPEQSPVVEGKIEITGEVVKVDWKRNDFGERQVMTVRDDRGFMVWGTVPSAIDDISRGDRVSFSASVEKSDSDETFGFFKRPTKAQVLAAA